MPRHFDALSLFLRYPFLRVTTFYGQHSPKSCMSRKKHIATIYVVTCLNKNLWTFEEGVVWVPAEADGLYLRLCIIAHTSVYRRCDVQATEAALRKKSYWSTFISNVHTFVLGCINCLSTTGGTRFPCPFGTSLHGTTPITLV